MPKDLAPNSILPTHLPITLPEVTTIKMSAFVYCKALKTITLINVKSIEEKTFQGCKALKTITIGNNISNIGNNAFEGCVALETVTIDANCDFPLDQPNVKQKCVTVDISETAFNDCNKNIKIQFNDGHLELNNEQTEWIWNPNPK